MTKNLYPEIANAGSLSKALDMEFEKLASPLRCTIFENAEQLPFAYARVENKKRFSQVYMAANEKLYLPDFWKEGVSLADGQTDNISKLAEVLHYWLSADPSIKALENKFQFVQANEKAEAFEENNEIEYSWNLILNDRSRAAIRPVVELAIKDNVLSKLFPFTSLTRLCFSRCTGYPYTYDAPIVIPIDENSFEVRMSEDKVVGRGTAAEAIKMVRDNLPLDIKPAVKGTAEDL